MLVQIRNSWGHHIHKKRKGKEIINAQEATKAKIVGQEHQSIVYSSIIYIYKVISILHI